MATHYIVQPFRKQGRRLVLDTARSTRTAEAAIATANRIAEKFVGVIAYEIDVEEDDVGEPRMLASHGEVPSTD
jgi:hypothetical protein